MPIPSGYYALDRDPHIYHVMTDCPRGKLIPPESRLEGKGGRVEMCLHCAKLYLDAIHEAKNHREAVHG